MTHFLFDTDGVLISSPMWSDEYSRRTGLDPRVMKPFFTGVFQECTLGKADLREMLQPYLTEWKWEGSVDAYLKAWFDFENQPDRELIGKIQELRKKGIQCHVATNQEKYRLEYIRTEMGFGAYFDSIFCSAEMGMKKPQEAYYQHIISSLHANPSDIIYFDDALENIESASSLGVKAIYYKSIRDFSS